jgi:hypothetical protein
VFFREGEKEECLNKVGIAAKSGNSANHSNHADEKCAVGLFCDGHFAE